MSVHDRTHTLHPRDRLGRPLPVGSPDELEERGEPGEVVASVSEAIDEAIELFDQRRFFEAHEFFEYVWKSDATAPEDRGFWKGLTQLAAACCHIQRGNEHGALTLLFRAAEHLRPYPSPHHELDTYALIGLARALRDIIHEHGITRDFPFPSFPRSADDGASEAPRRELPAGVGSQVTTGPTSPRSR